MRRLLTLRLVGLTLVALVLALACLRLGFWQLDRASESRAEPVAEQEHPVPLRSLGTAEGTLPASAAGQLVTAAGRYDAQHQYLVADREVAGQHALWVLTVLRLADGSGLLVVRGWVAPGTPAPAPPSGPVVVTARLAASEPPGGIRPVGDVLPPGEIAAVSPIDLLSSVPYPLYDAYGTLVSQVPAAPAGLDLVPAPQQAVASVPGFFLQHLAYVGLWWVFGLFVLFFWFRIVRDELAERPVVEAGQEAAAEPR